MRNTVVTSARWRSAATYAAFFVLFLLPFATLYAACTKERIETINGYQTLAPHPYGYEAADGSTKLISVGTDGFAWIAIALVAIGIGLSVIGFRTVWLSIVSVVGVVALFLTATAAGGSHATTKAEIGFWLSSIAVALAPAAGVTPRRRALIVGAATIAAAALLVLGLVGLIALIAKNSH